MIVGAFLQLIASILSPLVDILPTAHLGLPSATSIASDLAGLDSLIPVLGPLHLGAGMLLALVAFITIRLALVVWHLVVP